MVTTYYPSGGSTYTLQSSISSTQTTITLTSFTVPVSGDNFTMALMNTSIAYGTIAPRTSNAEFISFTGITQNADGTATLTGVTRGLDKNYPYTESTDFKVPHAGSTQFILSDAPQVFNKYAALQNDNTWTGRQQFPAGGSVSAAVVGVTYAAPTQDNEVATKKYIDDIAISGSPDATTSVKGIVELPTQTEQEAGTATGGTGATLVLTNNQYGARNNIGYAAGGGTPNTVTVTVTPTPTAYATGQVVGVLMPGTNTGAVTLDVNSLGAKAVQLGGAALGAGAVTTNTVAGFLYNGTAFEMVSSSNLISASAVGYKLALRNSTGDVTVNTTPTASTDAASKAYVDSLVSVYKNGTTTKNAADGSTTQTIAHGLGVSPKYVKVIALASQAGASAGDMNTMLAITSYNGTTQSSVSVYRQSTNNQTQATTFTLNGAGSDSATQSGVVTYDATNITITWTKTGSPTGTYNILWEANS